MTANTLAVAGLHREALSGVTLRVRATCVHAHVEFFSADADTRDESRGAAGDEDNYCAIRLRNFPSHFLSACLSFSRSLARVLIVKLSRL